MAPEFTDREKAECVLEEVRRRRGTYPRLCRDESMSLERANREIAIMEAIADEYLQRMGRT
jgi:hypothetical protein